MRIPEFPCRDCKANTVPIEGNREYYEVRDEIWHEAGATGKGQSDNGVFGYYLCIGCLESRLGRKLRKDDFKLYPANDPSPWLSSRLNARLGSSIPRWHPHARAVYPQYYPNALNDAVVEHYHPLENDVSPTGSFAFGITDGKRHP